LRKKSPLDGAREPAHRPFVKLARTAAVLILLAGCGGSIGAAPPATQERPVSNGVTSSPTPAIRVCTFQIGDIVKRAGAGAYVPPRGRFVGAIADGPTVGVELSISTSKHGVVTISTSINGAPSRDEVCKLP
jgi:hypothetical protein